MGGFEQNVNQGRSEITFDISESDKLFSRWEKNRFKMSQPIFRGRVQAIDDFFYRFSDEKREKLHLSVPLKGAFQAKNADKLI